MNCVIKSWIIGTIAADIADAADSHDASTRAAWLAIEEQFLGHRESRAIYRDAEFRNFCQGNVRGRLLPSVQETRRAAR